MVVSYRISNFRVKNLDERLLKIFMNAINIILKVLELECEKEGSKGNRGITKMSIQRLFVDGQKVNVF